MVGDVSSATVKCISPPGYHADHPSTATLLIFSCIICLEQTGVFFSHLTCVLSARCGVLPCCFANSH